MLALLKEQEFRADVLANDVLRRLINRVTDLKSKRLCHAENLTYTEGMKIMRSL